MINKDTIISLKLLTGEEICGKYISEDAQQINLDKPFRLVQNANGFGFAPMMVTTDPTLQHSIFKSAIAVITPTFKDIVAQYEFAVNQIPPEKEETKPASKIKTTPVESTQSLNKKTKLKV
jgi:hypothetical protein